MDTRRILALDFGEKRIGVAISDPLRFTAQGRENIDNNREKFRKIAKIVEEMEVCEIIVGLPRRFDGTIGESAKAVEKFADDLKKHVTVPIKFWEEWLTTSEAEKLLVSADVSRKDRKGVRDMIAAQLILQGYLDSIRERVPDEG